MPPNSPRLIYLLYGSGTVGQDCFFCTAKKYDCGSECPTPTASVAVYLIIAYGDSIIGHGAFDQSDQAQHKQDGWVEEDHTCGKPTKKPDQGGNHHKQPPPSYRC